MRASITSLAFDTPESSGTRSTLGDEEVVILSVDHPFVPEGRVASLMVRDAALAKRLADSFETLWAKAMRSLHEIAFQPGQRRSWTLFGPYAVDR